MTPAELAIERAITTAAVRVLTRRAAALRKTAADLTTTETDRVGRSVPIVDPAARIAIGTAELFEAAAADVAALLPGRRDDGPEAAGAPVGTTPRAPAPATAALAGRAGPDPVLF